MKNADTSVAMGADKARHVRETGAEVLVAGDNSCLMHIGGMLSRQQAGVRVMHLAEVLAATEVTVRPRTGHVAGDDRRGEPVTPSATFVGMPAFPEAARAALADTQLRHNLAHATTTIRTKRARVVGEVEGWEDLRLTGRRDQGERAARPRAPPGRAGGVAAGERRDGALGERRRRGERDRRPGSPRTTARTRWSR